MWGKAWVVGLLPYGASHCTSAKAHFAEEVPRVKQKKRDENTVYVRPLLAYHVRNAKITFHCPSGI